MEEFQQDCTAMDKIISIVISIIFLCACSGEKAFEGEKYNMIFVYNPWLKIDFETQVLNIDYQSLKYTDTIRLSKEDKVFITNSFYRNKIDEIKGNMLYADKYRTMPPSDFKIRLFNKEKLQAEIAIDFDYKNKGYLPFGQRYRVISFRDEVLEILNKNQEVQKALSVFTKYDSNLWRNHMK